MKIQILQTGIKTQVRRDDELLLKLANANLVNGRPVRVSTIERWLKEDSDKLTTVTNLQIIRENFNLPESEVLTQEEEILI